MSEPVTNGTTYPPQPSQTTVNTQVVAHLNLRELSLERGTTGLRRAGGWVREEFLQDLVGLRGIHKLREMADNSPVIGACLFAIQMLMRNVKWRLTPADTTPEAQHYADLAHGMLFDDLSMPWSLLMSEILSFLPFGWCLPGDQLILRGDGTPVPIQEVKAGDMVLTKYGRPRPVTQVMTRPYTDTLISLKVRGYPFPIRLTPEHRLPTTTGWKRAGDLTSGDELLRPRVPLSPGGEYDSGWLVGVYLAEGHRRADSRSSVLFSVHRTEAPALKIRIDQWVASHATPLLQEVQTLADAGMPLYKIAEMTGHTFTTIKRWMTRMGAHPRNDQAHILYREDTERRNGAQVGIARKEFRALIDLWVTTGTARTKALRQLPTEQAFAQGIVDGWMWGDGHDKVHDGKRWAKGTTTSAALASQMQLILGSLGIPAPMESSTPPRQPIHGRPYKGHDPLRVFRVSIVPERQVIWKRTSEQVQAIRDLRASGMSLNAIHRQTGLAWDTIKKWLVNRPVKYHANQCRVYPEAIGHTVLAIEHEPYEGLVYDLEVDEDHTFCAGPCIVSNSYFEMVFKRRLGLDPPPNPEGTPGMPSLFDDGLIGLGKIAPRAHETLLRWEFDHTGSLLGMHQLDPWSGHQAYLPLEKCLHFRPTSYKDSPEGRSVLRTAYRPYYLLTHIENTEGVGIERDLTGIPLIYGPPQWFLPSASPEEMAQVELLKRLGRSVRNDEQACIVLPTIVDQAGVQLLKFETVHAGGAKAINTDAIIQRYELRITQSMLCDLLFLGHEDVGSFALASSKSTTQSMSLGGYLQVIQDELQRRCLPLLWRLNAFPKKMMPELVHGDVETVDLTELARFILSFGRIYPMRDLENHIRGLAGLPERENAEQNPLPPAIQPHMGQSSHGGGSGLGDIEQLGISEPGSGGGLPDLDRALSSQSV